MMKDRLEHIADKVRAGARIAPDEALRLAEEAPLWLLSELATGVRRRLNGDKLYYNRNIHIEPTNLCVFNCRFCSYRRPKGSPEAWDYTMEEIEELARRQRGRGITEVHIVGGVHPDHDLEYYCGLIRRVRSILPEAAVKAFTAIELSYMIRKAGLTVREGLQRLIDAGMQAIQGPSKHVVVAPAPSIRATLGESFGMPVGTNVEGKMVTALKRLGFDKVFDVDTAADFTIMEEGTEFLHRVQNGGELPLITSCSPGWIRYMEQHAPDMLPNVSTCRSPQQMFGAVAKSYFAEKMGLELVVDDMGFTAALEAVQNGKSDIAMAGITVNEERKANMDFSDSYATGIQVVIIKEDSPAVQSLDDLSTGVLIGTQEGTTGYIYCSDSVENGGYGEEHVMAYETGAVAIQALLAGKVDCVVIDNEPAKAFVAEVEGLKILETEYVTEDYAAAMSKDNKALYDAVNAALEELIADGTVKGIVDKYITAE